MDGIKYKWMAPFSEHFRYRFHTGMVAWGAHRLTGIGIVIFIVVHIWSISHLGSGADSFNTVMALYNTPLFKVGEIILYGTILFHALNGLRIISVDFFGGARYQKKLFWGFMAVGVLLFLIGVWTMLNRAIPMNV